MSGIQEKGFEQMLVRRSNTAANRKTRRDGQKFPLENLALENIRGSSDVVARSSSAGNTRTVHGHPDRKRRTEYGDFESALESFAIVALRTRPCAQCDGVGWRSSASGST